MMFHAGLGGGCWDEVFLATNYLRNRGPVSGMSVTPQEMWSGKKSKVAHMKSFGCKVYCPIDRKDRGGKLGAVRVECVMLSVARLLSPSIFPSVCRYPRYANMAYLKRLASFA